jgi:hypothetical protein
MPSISSTAARFAVGEGGSSYPRANYLANGHILGAYTAFPPDSNMQQLTLVTSTNNGETWEPTGTAATSHTNEGDLDNAYPLQLPSGQVLLAYRNHDKNHEGKWTIYRITLSCSHDLGATWEFLCDAVVVEAKEFNNGVWEPFLRNAHDGTLQLYYSRERSNNNQDNMLLVSSDGGKTWGEEQPVSGSRRHTSRDGMVGIADVRKDSLLAVFETNDNGGHFSIHCMTSFNDGKTWEDRRPVYISPEGKNAGAPQITTVGETLVVSFMTDEDEEIGRHEWPSVAAAKLLTSTDGGVSWDNKLDIFPIHADWPGLLALRDEMALLYLAGREDGVKSRRVVLS